MVGQIIGAGLQAGSAIYGAIKSSQANKKAMELLQNQRDENKKWYEQRMAEDYTQRADVQNVLRKQKEMLSEQYKRARATNVVAGGTDEALVLQQREANEILGDTTANIAAQSEAYKEGIENLYREREGELAQQEIANYQNQAQAISTAAGQVGSAVSGLANGIGLGTKSGADSAPATEGKILGGTTTYDSYVAQDAKDALSNLPEIKTPQKKTV
jgi:hypothetical protein